MNVILLEAVENLGSIGDLVKVKPGYGRNYLLPQGKAKIASEENKAEIEARRAEFEQMAADALAAAEKRRCKADPAVGNREVGGGVMTRNLPAPTCVARIAEDRNGIVLIVTSCDKGFGERVVAAFLVRLQHGGFHLV